MTTSSDIRSLVSSKIAEEAIQRFLSKSLEYGDDVFEFGVEVQAVDMMRKMKKIKAALWDGRELQHEDLPELLHDMIGHCYITLARLELEGLPPYECVSCEAIVDEFQIACSECMGWDTSISDCPSCHVRTGMCGPPDSAFCSDPWHGGA